MFFAPVVRVFLPKGLVREVFGLIFLDFGHFLIDNSLLSGFSAALLPLEDLILSREV